MKYVLSAALFFFSTFTFATNSKQFIGSWDCFDPNDGGIGFARIHKSNFFGELIKEGADSWHGPCGYGWPAVTFTGPLTLSNGHLNGIWFLDCQAEPTHITGDREFDVEYKINARGELIESLFNNGTLIRDPIVCTRK